MSVSSAEGFVEEKGSFVRLMSKKPQQTIAQKGAAFRTATDAGGSGGTGAG